jgi:uncharacterized protein YbjT (DUF2867 family)
VNTAPVTFVAGATGYTGRAAVELLCGVGVRTVAHVRPGAPRADDWVAAFGALGADVDRTPWEPAAMRATLARLRPDHVFALLGTTRRRAAAEGIADAYETIDYGLTAMLRDAAISCGASPRFTYLSAMGADESSGNKYVAVRGRMERELREGPLPWLVAQPAFVSGSDRAESRPMERAFSLTLDALLGAVALVGLGSVRDRYASLTGRQLARGLVRLALDDRHGRRLADARALRAAGDAA